MKSFERLLDYSYIEIIKGSKYENKGEPLQQIIKFNLITKTNGLLREQR